ncbi:hypothetical protein ERO13_A03G017180v2 [Gossypium hirsutum]|uniref:Uncharacterized protein n=2 Tax=Gossypium TaxID=3633 RepID=A0A5J5W9M5_GOSBA|nr:hypothetical protein ES319_A03G026200v1 [Gossypium barbadense]KAB2088836.1 hypothetical protein ES319_A03G026200v1 [Gossypium barbadense]KAG4206599.1 hypothetical protein ERO13_A03G017180v2 [Gossypium hirsutum]TYH23643.1 hypothetical protein ES288_A03G030100v1 [Gossypium darwinii]TYH23644.1 hypothetical protein ES288_A03G030100v1 [Gossypium darwinii]
MKVSYKEKQQQHINSPQLLTLYNALSLVLSVIQLLRSSIDRRFSIKTSSTPAMAETYSVREPQDESPTYTPSL